MRNLRGFSIGNCGKEQGFATYEVGFVDIGINLTVLPKVPVYVNLRPKK